METIRSNTEISKLFETGRRVSKPDVLLIVCNTHGDEHADGRVAFVAGKKNGGAVWRNRAKRRMREAARAAGAPWPSRDVVLVAKKSTADCEFAKLTKEIEEAAGDPQDCD